MGIEPSGVDFNLLELQYKNYALKFGLEPYAVEEQHCIQTNLGCMFLIPYTGKTFTCIAFVPANTHLNPILDLRGHRKTAEVSA